MGNSTSSDEVVQEDVDNDVTIDENNHTHSKCGPDHDKAYSNNHPITENSGAIESSIVRMGSYQQPLKVTKIRNKNAKQDGILHGEGIHISRNRLKMTPGGNPPGNNGINNTMFTFLYQKI